MLLARMIGMRRSWLFSILRDVALAIVQDPLLAGPSILVVGMAAAVAAALILLN